MSSPIFTMTATPGVTRIKVIATPVGSTFESTSDFILTASDGTNSYVATLHTVQGKPSASTNLVGLSASTEYTISADTGAEDITSTTTADKEVVLKMSQIEDLVSKIETQTKQIESLVVYSIDLQSRISTLETNSLTLQMMTTDPGENSATEENTITAVYSA